MLKFKCEKCSATITENTLTCSNCGYENNLTTVNKLELAKAQRQVTEVADSVKKIRWTIIGCLLPIALILLAIAIGLLVSAIESSVVREYFNNGYSYGWREYTDKKLLLANSSGWITCLSLSLAFSTLSNFLCRSLLSLVAYKKISKLNVNMPYFICATTYNTPKISKAELSFITFGLRVFYDKNTSNKTSFYLFEVATFILRFMENFLLPYCIFSIGLTYVAFDKIIISSPVSLILLVISFIGTIVLSSVSKRYTWNTKKPEEGWDTVIDKEELDKAISLNPTEKDLRKSI